MDDERINRLTPSGRALVKTLLDIVEQILSGKCDEEEIEDVSRRVNPDMKDYKCEDDYVTIDEGMKILRFGNNRAGFCNLMRKNGIPNETFNNVKIGYNRTKIIALKHRLDEEYMRRKYREQTLKLRLSAQAKAGVADTKTEYGHDKEGTC